MTTTPRGRTDWQKVIDMRIADHTQRLSSLEQNQAVYLALSDERRKQMDERFTRVDNMIADTRKDIGEDVRGLQAVISRLNWLVISAVVTGFIGLLLLDKIKALL